MAPPAFLGDLLFWTKAGIPSVADTASVQSVAISVEWMRLLAVSQPGIAARQTSATKLEVGVRDLLARTVAAIDPSRKWKIEKGRAIFHFAQFSHIGSLNELVSSHPILSATIGRDYVIAPDVTVGLVQPSGPPILHAAVSCKTTIRSDRVQNIRHEAVVMTRHRRGRLPHIVAVTAEPLPSRLASIARGTGEIDAVYHVALPELEEAVARVGNAEARSILAELTGQGRLFDVNELPAYLSSC
jgi:hypothetical protein